MWSTCSRTLYRSSIYWLFSIGNSSQVFTKASNSRFKRFASNYIPKITCSQCLPFWFETNSYSVAKVVVRVKLMFIYIGLICFCFWCFEYIHVECWMRFIFRMWSTPSLILACENSKGERWNGQERKDLIYNFVIWTFSLSILEYRIRTILVLNVINLVQPHCKPQTVYSNCPQFFG